MNRLRVTTVDVGFERQFFQQELEGFIVRSLEIVWVVLFFQLEAKLFLHGRVINFQGFG
jgi:hypothetical protein